MSGSSSGAFSSRFRPLFEARKASSAPLQVVTSRAATSAASVRSQLEELDDPPGDVDVVKGECSLDTGADDQRVLTGILGGADDRRQVQKRRDEHSLAALCGRDHCARPVRRREDERRTCRLEVLQRRVAEVESRNANRLALTPENAFAEHVA